MYTHHVVGSVGLKYTFIATHGGSAGCRHGCSGGLIPTKTPEQLIQFSGSDNSFCKVPLQVHSTILVEIAFVSYLLLVMAWSSVSLLFMAQCHLFWISLGVCHLSLGRSMMRSHLILQMGWLCHKNSVQPICPQFAPTSLREELGHTTSHYYTEVVNWWPVVMSF